MCIRDRFLYDFYNFLAARSVRLVGGTPLLKGRILSCVSGDESMQRGVLLVVRYPSPRHFCRMLENTYFKLVSIVRSIAVQRFTFCLTRAINDRDFQLADDNYSSTFAVLMFRGDSDVMEPLLKELNDSSVSVIYSGLKTHKLSVVKASDKVTEVPVPMDGIIVFECSGESRLRSIAASTSFRSGLDNCSSYFVALLEKIT